MFATILTFAARMVASRLFMPSIVAIIVGFIFTTGYVKGNNHCVAKQEAAESKMEKKHDKIEENVNNVGHDALIKRLRKFQRD